MNKLIKASLLAGFLAHLWVTVSWMALPLHKATVHSFNDDPQIQLALLKGISSGKSAVYALPAMHSGKPKAGPSAFIALTPQGQTFSWKKIAIDLGNNILSAFLIGILLMMSGITGFKEKVKFATITGAIVISMSTIPSINWWGLAMDYAAVEALDVLIMSLIFGLVLAKFTEK